MTSRKRLKARQEDAIYLQDSDVSQGHSFCVAADTQAFHSSLSYGINNATTEVALRHNTFGSKELRLIEGRGADEDPEENSPMKKCRYCVYDGVFTHSGMDPVNKVGIWIKGTRRICVKKHSLKFQNNTGQFYICDESKMKDCHFYKQDE